MEIIKRQQQIPQPQLPHRQLLQQEMGMEIINKPQQIPQPQLPHRQLPHRQLLVSHYSIQKTLTLVISEVVTLLEMLLSVNSTLMSAKPVPIKFYSSFSTQVKNRMPLLVK